jgi:hypothetical protein
VFCQLASHNCYCCPLLWGHSSSRIFGFHAELITVAAKFIFTITAMNMIKSFIIMISTVIMVSLIAPIHFRYITHSTSPTTIHKCHDNCAGFKENTACSGLPGGAPARRFHRESEASAPDADKLNALRL